MCKVVTTYETLIYVCVSLYSAYKPFFRYCSISASLTPSTLTILHRAFRPINTVDNNANKQ